MTLLDLHKWLTERFDRVEDRHAEMTAQLDRNTSSLEIHIEGVNAVNRRVDQVQAQLEPIVSVVKFGSWCLKSLMAVGSIAGAVYGVVKLLKL